MAYQALYRAFRPKTLDDVVRQEHVVTILKRQIETQKIGHAYLFCGPRGTGKTSIAKIFAAAINCESPVGGSACGKCPTCKALAQKGNLDITEIDAASNNGVDEMRDLREKVQYPPVAGKYKVYIVDEVHMLSAGAFNALLKTLEEPPSHAVFILATTESQKIPATILSRCTRFDFKLIPQKDLEERLKYVLRSIGKEYEEEAVSALARAGAGSVRDMLSLADPCVSYAEGKLTYADVTAVLGNADFTATAELCAAFLKGNGGEAVEKCEDVLAEGKSVALLVKDILQFLNGCVVAKTCRNGDKILLLPPEKYAVVQKTASEADVRLIVKALEIFAAAESDCKYTTTPKITLETALLKASLVREEEDISALLLRVKALEEKIASGNFALRGEAERPRETAAAEEAERPRARVEETEKKEKPSAVERRAVVKAEPYDDAPPDENETGGNVYFDADYAAAEKRRVQSAQRRQEESDPFADVPIRQAEQPQPLRAAVQQTGDAKVTFGRFLRSLRSGSNGVLFTICMDMESAFDGNTFVVYTTKETLLNTLKRETNYPVVKAALERIGIVDFDIRLKGKEKDETKKAIDEIKEKFYGIDVRVKP